MNKLFINRIIVKNIINEEAKKENIKVNPHAVTITEYYKSDHFKKELKLQKGINKFKCFMKFFLLTGFNKDDEIYIFLKLIRLNPIGLIKLLQTSFHELEHSRQIQYKYARADYSQNINKIFIPFETTVINILEVQIAYHDYNFYEKYHDYFLQEIDANLYGYLKLKEYLEINKQHNDIKKGIDKHLLEYIDSKINLYNKKYDNYNFDLMFAKYHQLHNINPNSDSPLDDLIYENGTSNFKRILDIIIVGMYIFDKKTLYSIITSNSYLQELDFSKLTNDEITILIDALKSQKNINIQPNYLKKQSSINKKNLLKNLEEWQKKGLFKKVKKR